VKAADLDPSQRAALRRYRSWQRFGRGPRASVPLLATLDRYPHAVLVAGCQRSGTTMLTRVIAHSAGFRSLTLTRDDELDAALALLGEINLPAGERYCFQTTYLNERYPEYRALGAGHKLIWMVRNPLSVVHSMVYNWPRFALNELYAGCGAGVNSEAERRRGRRPWPFGPSALEKACRAYAGKAAQLEELVRIVDGQKLLVVDYDELVQEPDLHLPAVFRFVGEPYRADYARGVRSDATRKADALSEAARGLIERWAAPVHERCLALVTRPRAI
jgi:hypothetical protein